MEVRVLFLSTLEMLFFVSNFIPLKMSALSFSRPPRPRPPFPQPCPVIATLGQGYPLYACTPNRGCDLLNPSRERVQIRGCFNAPRPYPQPFPISGAGTSFGTNQDGSIVLN
jgi:hypothetical protein